MQNTTNTASTDEQSTSNENNNNTNDVVVPEETIQIVVKDLEGNEVVMKMKKLTPMSKLMQGYAKNRGSDLNSLRFLFDGSRILPEQTPKDLNMENDDIIEVLVAQIGGGYKYLQMFLLIEMFLFNVFIDYIFLFQ